MDRKTAQDTFTFYSHLMAAEDYRNQIYEIEQLGDQNPLTSAELTWKRILTRDAAVEINTSVNLLPNLTEGLDAAAT